jgi:hypothetical protein
MRERERERERESERARDYQERYNPSSHSSHLTLRPNGSAVSNKPSRLFAISPSLARAPSVCVRLSLYLRDHICLSPPLSVPFAPQSLSHTPSSPLTLFQRALHTRPGQKEDTLAVAVNVQWQHGHAGRFVSHP